MDPNKRGNPPFEPSSYAAGLERRVKRHEAWAREAREMAGKMLYGSVAERLAAERWWHAMLSQPEVVLSADKGEG